eukprot:tig00021094_g18098.t1
MCAAVKRKAGTWTAYENPNYCQIPGHMHDQDLCPELGVACQCVECISPDPRPWACDYRCACRQCEEAHSSSLAAASGSGASAGRFCNKFILHVEAMAHPGGDDWEACAARWQSELDECVARRGEQGLASITYALRLAGLFYMFSKQEKSFELYQMNLEIAEEACQECKRGGFLGIALYALGDLLFKWGLALDRAKPHLKEGPYFLNSDHHDHVQNCFARAETYVKRAAEEIERVSGEGEGVADILNSLGDVYTFMEHFDKAAVALRRAFILHEAACGLDHTKTEVDFKHMMSLLLTKHDKAHAAFLAEKALAFFKKTGRLPDSVHPGDIPLDEFISRLESAEYHSLLIVMVERALRAKRDTADRYKALDHIRESNWARARALLDALLKRSPGDVEARLLRIQCMRGVGRLDAAAREAEALEHELAAAVWSSSPIASTDKTTMIARVRKERQWAEAALRERREAEERADEAVRQLLKEAEQQRQQEDRRREEAARRAAEKAERRRRAEEARREAQRRREEEEQAARDRQRQQQQRLAQEREERRVAEEAERWRRQFEEERQAAPMARRTASDAAGQPLSGPAAQPGGPAREEPEPACAICLDSEPGAGGGPSSPVGPLPCGHRFHARCIATWRASPLGTSCPQCRAPFSGTASDPVPDRRLPLPQPRRPPAAGPSGALELAPVPAPVAPVPADPLEAAVAAAAMDQLALAPAPAPAPASAPPAPGPRPTRPYLPPGGPPARPTRPYDPFNRGAGAGPART